MLRVEQVEPAAPQPGEVQVRHSAIGVNFIDVYDRTGLYPSELPSGLGREAAGVIVAVGRRVRGIRTGDRVAYVYPKPGAYSELRNVPASRMIKIPKGISDAQAAALMLKGLTAYVLLQRVHRVSRGEYLLVHAAAGGVGSILTQWAKSLGAKVIGVVGSETKAQLARRNGCRHVLIATGPALAAGVRKITREQGVAVVYDSVGKDTFMDSLDCVRRRGLMVSYGNASGAPPALSPLELSKRGSLFLTRPTLFDYTAQREELEAAARALFGAVKRKAVRIQIGQTFRLTDAALAHRELEARRTTGSTILVP